jgi:hypothetical protein
MKLSTIGGRRAAAALAAALTAACAHAPDSQPAAGPQAPPPASAQAPLPPPSAGAQAPVSSPSASAQAPAAAPSASTAAPAVASEALARELLMRMARYLSSQPAFSVNVISAYDVVQASGQKIEFAERRHVVVNRPDRLSVETERSDGARGGAVFTGREIVLVDVTNRVYASEQQPAGGLDESILHFVNDLKMRLPLAVMLMQRLPTELERRVRSVDYVEKTNLLGTPSHHLAARGDTVDLQVWVADGAQPLPLRVVLTYKDAPGQPEFRAQFVDWNLAPAINETTFRPQIPDGAHKIQFAAQLAAARKAGQGGKP